MTFMFYESCWISRKKSIFVSRFVLVWFLGAKDFSFPCQGSSSSLRISARFLFFREADMLSDFVLPRFVFRFLLICSRSSVFSLGDSDLLWAGQVPAWFSSSAQASSSVIRFRSPGLDFLRFLPTGLRSLSCVWAAVQNFHSCLVSTRCSLLARCCRRPRPRFLARPNLAPACRLAFPLSLLSRSCSQECAASLIWFSFSWTRPVLSQSAPVGSCCRFSVPGFSLA
jgi:hypothetical protein